MDDILQLEQSEFNQLVNDDTLINYAKKFPAAKWTTDEFLKLSRPENATLIFSIISVSLKYPVTQIIIFSGV